MLMALAKIEEIISRKCRSKQRFESLSEKNYIYYYCITAFYNKGKLRKINYRTWKLSTDRQLCLLTIINFTQIYFFFCNRKNISFS